MDASRMNSSRFEGLTRRHFGLATGGALTALLGLTIQPDAAAKNDGNGRGHNHGRVKPDRQAKAQFTPVGGSGVGGFTQLHQRNKGQGTDIEVHATGLTPGVEYLSLYYDNPVCDLEPDSLDDQIGPRYFSNPAGNGQTHGEADDDLDEIGSVSVRIASDLTLVACATI